MRTEVYREYHGGRQVLRAPATAGCSGMKKIVISSPLFLTSRLLLNRTNLAVGEVGPGNAGGSAVVLRAE